MKTTVIAIALFLTGCTAALTKQNADLQEQNRRLWARMEALEQGKTDAQTDGAQPQTATRPQPAAPAPTSAPSASGPARRRTAARSPS